MFHIRLFISICHVARFSKQQILLIIINNIIIINVVIIISIAVVVVVVVIASDKKKLLWSIKTSAALSPPAVPLTGSHSS